METETALQQAETMLAPLAQAVTRPAANRLDAVLEAGKLDQAITALHQANWGYLSAITGVDNPAPAVEGEPAGEGHIEVLYHISEGAAIVTLRVTVPYSKAIVPSVCKVYPFASLYERELIEMFGVTVEGTPDSSRLLLPDSWPEGVYPLRKSFTGINSPTQA